MLVCCGRSELTAVMKSPLVHWLGLDGVVLVGMAAGVAVDARVVQRWWRRPRVARWCLVCGVLTAAAAEPFEHGDELSSERARKT
jgi:uncharacterized membrane protein